MNLKRIIKEEMDNSLEWIKDVKSNQDIAQEIADKTDIKDNEIDTPFTKKIPNIFSLSPLFSTYRYFSAYSTEYYGLTETEDIDDVWRRYKNIIIDMYNNLRSLDKIKNKDTNSYKNLNESDEMEWIQNINATPISMDEEWILVNDIDPKNIEEGKEIQKYLFDLGYKWGSPTHQDLKEFCIYAIYHYPEHSGGGKMLYHDGCKDAEIRITNRDIEKGLYDKLYYWSEIKPTSINESDDLQWIKDTDPNNIHIRNLEKGMVVMIKCKNFPFLKNREFTVDEIIESYREGEICVHFKEMDKIQYPFGEDREPTIPGMNICEHLGCNFKIVRT